MSSESVQNGTAEKGLSPKQQAFLAAYTEAATVSGAARATGVSTSTHYRWIADGNPAYLQAFADARRESARKLEDVARCRAIDGVRRYKFNRSGFPIQHPETGEHYYETVYSDTLLIFLLKGLMPDTFGEKQQVTHDVSDWRGKLEERGIDPDKFITCLREATERYEQQHES